GIVFAVIEQPNALALQPGGTSGIAGLFWHGLVDGFDQYELLDVVCTHGFGSLLYDATGQVTAVEATFGPQLGITALIAPSCPPAVTIKMSSGRSTTGI